MSCWPSPIRPRRRAGIALLLAAAVALAANGQCVHAGPPNFVVILGEERLDGMDLSGLLFKGEPLPERTLFWRIRQDRAARRGPWKLVSVAGGAPMLFDLTTDLGEERDVARQHPEVVKALEAALEKWEGDVKAAPTPSEAL